MCVCVAHLINSIEFPHQFDRVGQNANLGFASFGFGFAHLLSNVFFSLHALHTAVLF